MRDQALRANLALAQHLVSLARVVGAASAEIRSRALTSSLGSHLDPSLGNRRLPDRISIWRWLDGHDGGGPWLT